MFINIKHDKGKIGLNVSIVFLLLFFLGTDNILYLVRTYDKVHVIQVSNERI